MRAGVSLSTLGSGCAGCMSRGTREGKYGKILNLFESGPTISRNCYCAGDISDDRRGIAGYRGARRYSAKGCKRRITVRRKEDLAIAVRAKCINCRWGALVHKWNQVSMVKKNEKYLSNEPCRVVASIKTTSWGARFAFVHTVCTQLVGLLAA